MRNLQNFCVKYRLTHLNTGAKSAWRLTIAETGIKASLTGCRQNMKNNKKKNVCNFRIFLWEIVCVICLIVMPDSLLEITGLHEQMFRFKQKIEKGDD